MIAEVRGKGLLIGLVMNEQESPVDAWSLCLKLMDAGLLAKPTQETIVRLAPPLTITSEQATTVLEIIRGAVEGL